jgi:hypothetical protein
MMRPKKVGVLWNCRLYLTAPVRLPGSGEIHCQKGRWADSTFAKGARSRRTKFDIISIIAHTTGIVYSFL